MYKVTKSGQWLQNQVISFRSAAGYTKSSFMHTPIAIDSDTIALKANDAP
jgi:hypothetical protein